MKKFTTSVEAINPHTGELNLFNGPVIEAVSWEQAQYNCDNNGLGYCRVDGEYKGEKPDVLKHELN